VVTSDESFIIVQATDENKLLNQGTLLVLRDNSIVGLVQELIGPVTKPIYVTRFLGSGNTKCSLTLGCKLFTIKRLADFLIMKDIGDSNFGFSLKFQ